MLSFKTFPSTPSTHSATAHPTARLRRWGARVSTSLLLLACGGPAQLDLGSDESALENPTDRDHGGTNPALDPTTGEVPPIAGGTEAGEPGTGSTDYPPCAAAGTQDPTTGGWPSGADPTTGEPGAGTQPAGHSTGGGQAGAGTQATGLGTAGTGSGVPATQAADPSAGAGEPVAGTRPAGHGTGAGQAGAPATEPARAGSTTGGGTYYPPCPVAGASSPTPGAWPSGNEPPAIDPATGGPAPTTEPSSGGQPAPTTSATEPAFTGEPRAGGAGVPATTPTRAR
jgi:hypothetical protein